MLERCYDEKHVHHRNYGGRGITVCDRWRESFGNFLEDMGERPVGLSLERKNNNLGYFKDNCKWATPKEQGRNKRNTILVTFNGQTMTIMEWSEKTGINAITIRGRLRKGYEVGYALTAPPQQGGKSPKSRNYTIRKRINP